MCIYLDLQHSHQSQDLSPDSYAVRYNPASRFRGAVASFINRGLLTKELLLSRTICVVIQAKLYTDFSKRPQPTAVGRFPDILSLWRQVPDFPQRSRAVHFGLRSYDE